MDVIEGAEVEQELREYAKEQGGSAVGMTIGGLLRTDRDRLRYWSGRSILQNLAVQKTFDGDEERCVIEAAERFSELRPAIGFLLAESVDVDCGYYFQSGAWLVVHGGAVSAPAGNRRSVAGLLGVELTATEAARWTPTHRHEVARRGVLSLALG